MKHGGDLTNAMKRYGGSFAAWLDLSTGINPWPWPMPGDLPITSWQRLPSGADEERLLAAARRAYQIPADAAIVPAAGTQALIQWLPHLAASGAVAIVSPTYNEHASCWTRAGHEVIAVGTLSGMPGSACHAVVVNPNNPDGHVTGRDALAQVAELVDRRKGWLVVDESFGDVVPDSSAVSLCAHRPVVVLRSFGKFYGLAGLRLGFAIATPAIAQRIAEALGPWAVSGPAIEIGCAALEDKAWADGTRRRLRAQAERLDAVLVAAGCAIVGGTPLFRLARHPRATALHHSLAQQRIWTRAFTERPDVLRFGLPPDQDGLDRLSAALAVAI